jgi:hypothetical protein
MTGGGGVEVSRRPLFTSYSLAKVRLNVKVVTLTRLGKTQQVIGLLCTALKVMSNSL